MRHKILVHRNDLVKIISGDDRGKTGKVLRVLRQDNKLIVEGINFVWKHLRKSQQHPRGARIRKEAPVSISSVMVVCQSCDKPTRIAMRVLPSGEKIRACKRCKGPISVEETQV